MTRMLFQKKVIIWSYKVYYTILVTLSNKEFKMVFSCPGPSALLIQITGLITHFEETHIIFAFYQLIYSQ